MLTLSSAQAREAGWTVQKSDTRLPRMKAPDGAMYVRCTLGRPAVTIIQPDGSRLLLQRVAYRSGDSLLRMLRVSR